MTSSLLRGALRPDLLRPETLADLFEATAARRPGHAALVDGGVTLSYGELDALSWRVAARLTRLGAGPGRMVALWHPRGAALLALQLGIARAGAAWLPMDADVPAERVQVCMEDGQALGVITTAERQPLLAPSLAAWDAATLLAPEAPDEALAQLSLRVGACGQDPAYVIYTSGSTGKPKGIQINQASICHFLRSENEVLGVKGEDKVYQGFSVAFDMSFEEIWISYLVGATLWIAPAEIAADPDALPAALQAAGVTVLHAVPTLLALFAQDVPSLRLINLGGEMCPDSLVQRFDRPGRAIFNTYGPTEATVSASLARLRAGEPVTIGTPLPNYGLMVIQPLEQPPVAGQPVPLVLQPAGEVGELCITGPGVALGYLGRPDLTAEKFLPNPFAGSPEEARLYRTGDLARVDEHGQIHCLGRVDDQVKIRGFRVELGEIEAALLDQPGVGTAAVLLCQDDGLDLLAAYMVADQGGEEPLPRPTDTQLRQALSARLPAYMVPQHFEWLTAMPRLTSGKIDRKALKALPRQRPAQADGAGFEHLEGPARVLLETLARFFPGQALHLEQDFFRDLGGHSLLAARFTTALRAQPGFGQLTVRDLYQHRRLDALLAAAVGQAAATAEQTPEWTPPADWRRWLCGLAQALSVPPLIALRMAQWLAPFFTYHFLTGEPGDDVALAVLASLGSFLLATLVNFAVAALAKRLVLGRLPPGRYPLWGWTYLRWWWTDRLLEAAPVYLLSGSSLYSHWLRLLGAQVGDDVVIGSITLRSPDNLVIGDRASLGTAVHLENAKVVRSELHIGRIEIGDDGYVGSYAVVEGGTRLEAQGHLLAQSSLATGQQVPQGEVWTGSPAAQAGRFDPASLPPRPPVSAGRKAAEAVFFVLGALLIASVFFMPVFPSFVLMDWLDEQEFWPWLNGAEWWWQVARYFVLALPASAVLIILTALVSAGIRWTVLPRLRAGMAPVHSLTYCRKWLVNQIQENSLQVLHGVYATVYAPFWYRLLGAKVGRDAEISTALGVVPDMLTLGDETFIADAVLLGDEEIDGGWMSMQPTVISRRSFVGNGAYVPDGTVLPENCLVGVHSVVPANADLSPGQTWVGTPPVLLPAREETAGFPEHLTFHPSWRRRLARSLVEAVRIGTPHALIIAVGYTTVLDVMPDAAQGLWWNVALDLTFAGLLYGLGSFLFVVLLKWLLIGRYDRKAVPMWTRFVWFSEGVTNLFESIAVPNFLRYLRGTPWLPLAFQMLGTRVGRGVYMDTTDITEFDCVTLGDHAELNALTCPQTHLFEDRVMKIDHVHIGQRANLGARSTVLYSARMEDHSQVGPLTLVMKGESIPARGVWHGVPASPVRSHAKAG